jgi:mercuric ion binding protein
MKTIAITILIGILPILSFGQNKPKKFETIVLKTSAQCGDCEQRIEDALNYTKGIKYAELNLEDNAVTVKFQNSKISLQEIKTILNNTGYDADDMKAPEEFVQKLPACCQPGGME